jgi:PiT family inorganic phosphate transporter
MTVYIAFLIVLALIFDFLNGFHDAANSIATIVSTRVLSPRYAVIWAAFFNFIAFLVFGLHVAGTVGSGIIDVNIIDNTIILATLTGACLWNIITWYLGLPTSSSHALIGGLIGAALVKVGINALVFDGILKTIIFIFVSPIVGFVLGLVFGIIVHWVFHKSHPARVDKLFRKGQLLSAAFYSLGHGGNDAQKTMGIIGGLLFSNGLIHIAQGQRFQDAIPFWVVISCQAAIALGTMFGGWRIVKTMGQRVVKLRPVDGFCAEFGAAFNLFVITSYFGIPVSTTHTITGAIMGVGTLKRFTAVRWGIAGQIIWAWVLTIPLAAVISALTYVIAVQLT